jgi:hypothetical protein
VIQLTYQDISDWVKVAEIAYKWGILANVTPSNKLTSTKLLVTYIVTFQYSNATLPDTALPHPG